MEIEVHRLGRGGWSEVFAARRAADGRVGVLKRIRRAHDFVWKSELEALRRVQGSVHVVELWGVVDDDVDCVGLFMPHCGRSLLDWFDQPWPVRDLVHQLLLALVACHRCRVVHGDVKTSNLVVDERGFLTLVDFGSAGELGVRYTTSPTTLWYRAPEVLVTGGVGAYTAGIDLWAAGVVFLELANGGTPPFRGTTDVKQYVTIFNTLATPGFASCVASHAGLRVLRGLLDPAERRRGEAVDWIHHEYFCV